MAWVTAEQVRNAINFPSTGAPISDAVINEFILDAQDEIERLYKTKFGNVEDYGSITDADQASVTCGGASFTVSAFQNKVLWIAGGNGNGQYRLIQDNDETVIYTTPDFDTIPTSGQAVILDLGYKDETVDGNGEKFIFTEYVPLHNLISLEIDDTAVTASNVYTYKDKSMLYLGDSAEVSIFMANEPQQVNIKYVYGVYPIPRIILRLCTIIAGMRTLVAQIAGTYDDFTNISLPGLSGSKGEPYTNIREAVTRLQTEAANITTKAYVPFVLFG